MEKSLFASKTLIGSALMCVAYLSRAFGYELDVTGLEGPVSDLFQNLTALIGLVLTIYGRFAATRKITLLTAAAEQPPGPPATAGFIQLPLLFMLVSLALIGCLANGCATTSAVPPADGSAVSAATYDTPLQLAGKSLLAVKSTIVTSATAVDSLCKAGKIGPDKCTQAASAYGTAKSSYDAAVDTYLLWSLGHSDQTGFNASLSRVTALANSLLQLSGQ